jgi:hypothetical protein
MEAFIVRRFRRGRSWVSLAALVLLAVAVGLGGLLPSAVAGPRGHDFRATTAWPAFQVQGRWWTSCSSVTGLSVMGTTLLLLRGGVCTAPSDRACSHRFPPSVWCPVSASGMRDRLGRGRAVLLADGVSYAPTETPYCGRAAEYGWGRPDRTAKLYIYRDRARAKSRRRTTLCLPNSWAVGQTGFDPTTGEGCPSSRNGRNGWTTNGHGAASRVGLYGQ